MNILIVLPSFRELGAGQQALSVARHLANDEFRISVVAVGPSGPLQDSFSQLGIRTEAFNARPRDWPKTAWRIHRLARQNSIRVLHSWSIATNVLVSLAARRTKAKTIGMVERTLDHRLPLDEYWPSLGRRLDTMIVPHTSISESPVFQSFRWNQCETIPSAAIPMTEACQRKESARRALLIDLDLADKTDIKLIGAVCEVTPQARLNDLVWAVDLLERVRDDVHLVVWGEGSYLKNVQRFAEAAQIADHVHFRNRTRSFLPFLPALDMFWHAHDLVPFDNGILAAMSSALPVMSAASPSIDALIQNGETGTVVPLGAKDDFARWTLQLIDNEAEKARLGNAAAQWMRDHFSQAEMGERYREVYLG